jgi:hypothetical protein
MNYLKDRRVYLSGAIDHSPDGGVGWRKAITPKLLELGLQVYDPTQDPKQTKASSCHQLLAEEKYDEATAVIKSFVRKDLALVDRSDIIIAKISLGITMTGTVDEIITSTRMGHKPTLLFCNEGKKKIPAWYFGIIPHRHMFSSAQQVINYLIEVDKGLHVDDRRWNYIYGLI